MFMDWKNQHCQNGHTTQSNLQIQCNPHQATNGIFQRTKIISKFVWKYKKSLIAKAVLRKKNGTGGINLSDFSCITKPQSSRQYGTGTKTEINLIFFVIFGSTESYLLYTGFIQLCQAGAIFCCTQTSHCGWLLFLWSTDSRSIGLSSCTTWTQNLWLMSIGQQLWLTSSRALTHQLWHMNLVALWHVESFWMRDQTHVPCIVRQLLIHCAA